MFCGKRSSSLTYVRFSMIFAGRRRVEWPRVQHLGQILHTASGNGKQLRIFFQSNHVKAVLEEQDRFGLRMKLSKF